MEHRKHRPPCPGFVACRSRLDETITQRHRHVSLLPLDRADTKKLNCTSSRPRSWNAV